MDIPTYKFALTAQLVESCSGSDFSPEDFIPIKAEPKATGWDVRCANPQGFDLRPGCYYKIPLGFRAICPPGWWMQLDPRSSTFIKRHLHALYGKIDETYPDEWFFLCQYMPDACKIQAANHLPRLEFGDRIGQIIPIRRQEMNVSLISNEELDAELAAQTAGRQGGLGSTGEQ